MPDLKAAALPATQDPDRIAHPAADTSPASLGLFPRQPT
jgi:hypothetical protein